MFNWGQPLKQFVVLFKYKYSKVTNLTFSGIRILKEEMCKDISLTLQYKI